ncbi:MAG: hypothetical protein IT381_14865 [Deltaproteobacteria bacterium]|nr:hypothetical protein [Deltaproteobacteria bacterium]
MSGDFDESKHPRADDGKFGEGGGSSDVKVVSGSGKDVSTPSEPKEPPKEAPKAFVPSKEFHYAGPQSPRVLFVIVDEQTPTPVERVRGEALVGDDALRFEKRYLAPLGMRRDDVGVAWMAKGEEESLVEAVGVLCPEGVVCLGGALVSETLRGFLSLPRFARVRDVYKASHEEEIQRKLKALRKNIDARAALLRPSVRPLPKAARPQDGAGIENASMVARLYKADAPERVVYGVVLDPYAVDLQGDWVPPREIRDTAWSFVAKHGYSSNRHVAIAEDTHVVESFVEPYPSDTDEQRAMQNLPHRAYRRKFGNETIHSGAWAIAMKLSPELWAQYQRGELNAFSIEGFGTRVPMDDASSEMPQVTFVDVERVI